MTTAPRRRRFRFAFSLRTLFVVVTVVAVAIWIAPAYRTMERKNAIKLIEKNGGYVVYESFLPPAPPSDPIGPFRRTLGDRAVTYIAAPRRHPANQPPHGVTEAEFKRIEELFPEVRVMTQ
jgi:hypothetical protein